MKTFLKKQIWTNLFATTAVLFFGVAGIANEVSIDDRITSITNGVAIGTPTSGGHKFATTGYDVSSYDSTESMICQIMGYKKAVSAGMRRLESGDNETMFTFDDRGRRSLEAYSGDTHYQTFHRETYHVGYVTNLVCRPK